MTGADGKHIVGSRQILQRHYTTSTSLLYVITCPLPPSHTRTHINVKRWMPHSRSTVGTKPGGELDIKGNKWRKHRAVVPLMLIGLSLHFALPPNSSFGLALHVFIPLDISPDPLNYPL